MSRAAQLQLPRSAADRGFWAFALHLWTVWALALSNFLLLPASLWALAAARGRTIPWHRFRGALAPLGLYALFLVAAIAGSYEPARSLGSARELLSLVPLVVALVLLRDERRVRRLVDGLVLMGGIVALLGLAQILFGYGGLHHRIRGPFSHWMTFAGVVMLCLLLGLARLAHRPAGGHAWRWAALAVMAAALVMSLTRSAWVALLLAVLVLLALRAPRYLAALVPAALALVLLAPVPVVERALSIFDLREYSNYDRLCMAEAGLLMISERPLFGIGPGLVRDRYPLYGHPTAPRQRPPHLHSSFLQIGAEKGLPALAAYLWLMLGALRRAAARFRAEGGWAGERADLCVGVMLVLLAFNLAGLFEDNWSDTEVQRIVLFVVAIPYCLPSVAGRPGRAPA